MRPRSQAAIDRTESTPPPSVLTVLYDQTSNSGNSGTSSQDFGSNDWIYNDQAADDFVVPWGQTWSIQEVFVDGFYSLGPAASVNVIFYADQATLPTGGFACSRYSVIPADSGGDFTIPLSPACVLAPGTYWISVQAKQDFGTYGQWYWMNRTTASNSGAVWRNPSNGFDTGCKTWGRKEPCLGQTEPDQIFRLSGTNVGVTSPCSAWQSRTPMPLALHLAAVATDGLYAYVAGGDKDLHGGFQNTFYRYDSGADTWATLPVMADAVREASAVYSPINKRVYVFGGFNGIAMSAATRIYDVASNTWSPGANMPGGRSSMASAYYNGKIYLIGGFAPVGGNYSPRAQVWEYDPIANTWNTSRANIPIPVGMAAFGLVNGHLILAGGEDDFGLLNTAFDYDIAANSWTQRASLLNGVDGQGGGTVNGRLRLFGGSGYFGFGGDQSYDPFANAWWVVAQHISGLRSYIAGAAVGRRLFAVGGVDYDVNGNGTVVATAEMSGCAGLLDFDTDGKTDRTVFRASTGVWYTARSGGGAAATGWGVPGDVDVLGDYDGDGRPDIAVFRPSASLWQILQSSDAAVRVESWGTNGDIPLAGDVDGDRKDDLVIWRPSAGAWFVKKSAGGTSVIGWGTTTDQALLADFDGDGKMDATVFRPSNGVWYIVKSSGGVSAIGWGTTGDIPVPGDFDADGTSDVAVFRPTTGQWFVKTSSGAIIVAAWGVSGDVPVAGDWDADGRSDFTIWRPTTGVWFTQYAAGGTAVAGWGVNGDKPIGRLPGS